MLIPVPPTECMRARESASAQLDGELSELEVVRLDAHLRDCAECSAYAREIGGIARELRAAELARPWRVIAVPPMLGVRGFHLRVAGVAAAVVVGAAGLSFALGGLVGHGGNNPGTTATADLASLRADSTQQHLLAMIRRLGPLPPAKPGTFQPV
jgi:predicted anti-sigma-YlaC factor YlaD